MSLIKINIEEKFLLDIKEEISYTSKSLRRGVFIRCQFDSNVGWFDLKYNSLPVHLSKKLEELYNKNKSKMKDEKYIKIRTCRSKINSRSNNNLSKLFIYIRDRFYKSNDEYVLSDIRFFEEEGDNFVEDKITIVLIFKLNGCKNQEIDNYKDLQR